MGLSREDVEDRMMERSKRDLEFTRQVASKHKGSPPAEQDI
jgi:hypothetical protein